MLYVIEKKIEHKFKEDNAEVVISDFLTFKPIPDLSSGIIQVLLIYFLLKSIKYMQKDKKKSCP